MKSLGIDVDHKVDLSMSGKETLQFVNNATKLGVKYSMIITDIQMPEMSGIEMTKILRQFFNN